MKCKVCNCEVTSGSAKCLKCGFPVLQMVKGDVQEEKRMNELASSFRKKKIEPVRIYLTVYKNALENGQVNVIQKEKILLAQGEELLMSKFLWYPEKFARLSSVGTLELSVIHTNGEAKTANVSMSHPNISDFWQIGIIPLDGMEFKLALGNTGTYSCSENISYL